MLIWKVLNNNGLIGAKFASTLPISSVIARFSPILRELKRTKNGKTVLAKTTVLANFGALTDSPAKLVVDGT